MTGTDMPSVRFHDTCACEQMFHGLTLVLSGVVAFRKCSFYGCAFVGKGGIFDCCHFHECQPPSGDSFVSNSRLTGIVEATP